jgi:hypothetical protein
MEWYLAQFYHGAAISSAAAYFLSIIQILLIFAAQGLQPDGGLGPPEKK